MKTKEEFFDSVYEKYEAAKPKANRVNDHKYRK